MHSLESHSRELGHWIAEYLADIERYPVRARVAPGEIRASLGAHAPEHGEPLDRVVRDARTALLPGITHWQHPGFLGYFANSATEPGILAEFLTAALNVNGMLWATCPAASELEELTTRWLAELVGLGDGWFGQLTDTASTSTLLALAAARDADPAIDARQRGLAGRADLAPLRVYSSEHAHSSVDKAVMTLGIGLDNLVKIPVDDAFRLRPDVLAERIATDRARGLRPIAVVAVVGTTSVASIDPVSAIAEICARERLWLHVDAAYAGPAAIAPEYRWILAGANRADSIVINPHKWMATPVGCSALWVRDANALRRAFALVPEYLRTETTGVVDYHDAGFQLGRPFRALKLWMVMRTYGAEGLRTLIRTHCAIAQCAATWIAETPHWRVVAPVHLSLVCARYEPPGRSPEDADADNMRILAAVNASGRALISHTKVNGRVVLRIAIGNARTEERHVRAAWDLMRGAPTSG